MASFLDGELKFKLAVRNSSACAQNDFIVQSLPTLTRISTAWGRLAKDTSSKLSHNFASDEAKR